MTDVPQTVPDRATEAKFDDVHLRALALGTRHGAPARPPAQGLLPAAGHF